MLTKESLFDNAFLLAENEKQEVSKIIKHFEKAFFKSSLKKELPVARDAKI